MKLMSAVVGATAMFGLVAFTLPAAHRAAPTTLQVMVHCPAGGHDGFVTPASATIKLGDNVEWRMTGQVMSDSIIISLKDPEQAWPFAGSPPHGGSSAAANGAAHQGHYGYNVTLYCRAPGGGTHEVVIDPDIIIQ